jgi:Protein of unknown function (DUF1353)
MGGSANMLHAKYWTICGAVVYGLAMAASAQPVGRFSGEPAVKMLPDGRNMELISAFSYIDPTGQTWNVPAGTKTDGASIPRILWLTYPPFTGKYRQAAVVHDYYCQLRSHPWKDTHKVFYDAMLTSGVAEKTAKIMYAAVYGFGPRWGTRSDKRAPAVERNPSPAAQTQVLRDLEAWIARDNPSAEDIERALDSGRVPK